MSELQLRRSMDAWVLSEIAIASDKETIRLTAKSGDVIYLIAEGDCCSHSWFEHISGVKQALYQKIIRAEEVDMPEAPPVEAEGHECLQTYGFRIITERGAMLIEYRNSSNGDYGGSIRFSVGPYDTRETFTSVLEDF